MLNIKVDKESFVVEMNERILFSKTACCMSYIPVIIIHFCIREYDGINTLSSYYDMMYILILKRYTVYLGF